MQTLKSSVLIISHPDPNQVGFGADFAADFASASALTRDHAYQVVVLHAGKESFEEAIGFLSELNAARPHSQRIIVHGDIGAEALLDLINTGNIFKVLSSFDDARFASLVREAMEEYSLVRQSAEFLGLASEQNEHLKRLSIELEDRVEKRQRFLEDARKKMLATNGRMEGLHRALVAVHKAASIAELERLTSEALQGALGLSWVRILFSTRMPVAAGHEIGLGALHSTSLFHGHDELGRVYFAREQGPPFVKDETAFLNQIADAISLAIVRLNRLEQSEELKHQWEATFDAISDPVCLIDANYVIQRINRAFAERCGTDSKLLIGRSCHQALFGRDRPCVNCKMGASFRLDPASTTAGEGAIYDVFSQEIRFKPRATVLYVNVYRDVSDRLRLERQVLESAKMAELGVIGSSIAHELNNPLGGMLSFIQLIRMDLKGDEPWGSDILDMENGAQRCREIVKNLLGFARRSPGDDPAGVDPHDAANRALKLTTGLCE